MSFGGDPMQPESDKHMLTHVYFSSGLAAEVDPEVPTEVPPEDSEVHPFPVFPCFCLSIVCDGIRGCANGMFSPVSGDLPAALCHPFLTSCVQDSTVKRSKKNKAKKNKKNKGSKKDKVSVATVNS
jgi:hypothetical protein